MAIIRKGDKKAEADLKKAATQQRQNRRNASDNEKKRAGLTSDTVYIDPKTKKAHTLGLGNPVTGNAYDIVRKPFSGPISGSAVAKKKATKKKMQTRQSGIIQSGKVIKGGSLAEKLAKRQTKKGK